MTIPPLPRGSRGDRPWFLDEPDSERLLTMVVALAAEVSMLHDKLDTLRALSGTSLAEIEAHEPDAITLAARAARRTAFVDRVFRIVEAEAERAGHDGPAYAEVMKRLAGE